MSSTRPKREIPPCLRLRRPIHLLRRQQAPPPRNSRPAPTSAPTWSRKWRPNPGSSATTSSDAGLLGLMSILPASEGGVVARRSTIGSRFDEVAGLQLSGPGARRLQRRAPRLGPTLKTATSTSAKAATETTLIASSGARFLSATPTAAASSTPRRRSPAARRGAVDLPSRRPSRSTSPPTKPFDLQRRRSSRASSASATAIHLLRLPQGAHRRPTPAAKRRPKAPTTSSSPNPTPPTPPST